MKWILILIFTKSYMVGVTPVEFNSKIACSQALAESISTYEDIKGFCTPKGD